MKETKFGTKVGGWCPNFE